MMRILVVNDDSVSAPGIALLARVASRFGQVTVVAPARQCSAMSQKLTLNDPMLLQCAEGFPAPVCEAYSLDGTPVDCVKVALNYIMKESPDWIFSGINNGYNVGYDIAYSGTLGAAFEGARNNIPSVAFSIASEKHLGKAEEYLEEVIRILISQDQDPARVWNVNFPPLATKPVLGILWDRTEAQVSLYREDYLSVPQPDGSVVLTTKGIPTPDAAIPEGTDAQAVRLGYISIGRVDR